VPKVHNKPIKSPRKGSNKKSKIQLKAALVLHTGLSGVPPDSVRCTREINYELATFGNLGSRSAIIHRTVRCSTGLSGVPTGATSSAPTVVCKRWTVSYSARTARAEVRAGKKVHRTVNRTCPVHHRTVRWPRCQKLQRSNPNGWVTWLALRTVSDGASDCPVRPSTAEFPNGHFGGWGYKYPQPPHIQGIQVFSHCIQYKSSRLHSKTQTRDQILSQVQRSFQSNSD
jgi:hypothetical protein